MPLLIDLKPGEKVIINGAVIENAGANTKLRLHNECSILRQKEILVAEEVGTPAARVYFCLQNAYIFPEKRDHYLEFFDTCLSQYVEACPSATPIAQDIRAEVAQGHYYRALKCSRKLLGHETTVLDHLRQSAEQASRKLDELADKPE
ncbi:MAG TPA: flagellar biosynthesis repressor FlbT [Magnetospirillum sp.]|nr:flagellar biosynthesis repressor FlbT [Magnetospirillum sp.]